LKDGKKEGGVIAVAILGHVVTVVMAGEFVGTSEAGVSGVAGGTVVKARRGPIGVRKGEC
jgi:hypothetical protein